MAILPIVYWVLGYWAVNKVWYSKKVYLVHDSMTFYAKKVILAAAFGWILIPIAILMKLFGK